MRFQITTAAATAAMLFSGVLAFDARARADDAPAPATASPKQAAAALEQEVVALLAAVDPASDLAALQKTLAPKLAAAVAKQFDALRPGAEATVIESTDGRFVIVVAAESGAGTTGAYVRATSSAELLLAVGGSAGPRPQGGKISYGGTGYAEATKGIGLSIGGEGGRGDADGVGGAGGGAAGATGAVGSIALGGDGGTGNGTGGHGSAGTGVDPVNLRAIVQAAKAWNEKK